MCIRARGRPGWMLASMIRSVLAKPSFGRVSMPSSAMLIVPSGNTTGATGCGTPVSENVSVAERPVVASAPTAGTGTRWPSTGAGAGGAGVSVGWTAVGAVTTVAATGTMAVTSAGFTLRGTTMSTTIGVFVAVGVMYST